MNGTLEPSQFETLPLRDIHLPEAVSWWPPAPGWWICSALVLASTVGYFLWRRWRERTALRRAAVRELSAIRERQREDPDPGRTVQALSMLLRRVAILYRPEAASSTGATWLAMLDDLAPGQDFTKGPARSLAEAPYRRPMRLGVECDIDELFKACEAWLNGLPPATSRELGRV